MERDFTLRSVGSTENNQFNPENCVTLGQNCDNLEMEIVVLHPHARDGITFKENPKGRLCRSQSFGATQCDGQSPRAAEAFLRRSFNADEGDPKESSATSNSLCRLQTIDQKTSTATAGSLCCLRRASNRKDSSATASRRGRFRRTYDHKDAASTAGRHRLRTPKCRSGSCVLSCPEESQSSGNKGPFPTYRKRHKTEPCSFEMKEVLLSCSSTSDPSEGMESLRPTKKKKSGSDGDWEFLDSSSDEKRRKQAADAKPLDGCCHASSKNGRSDPVIDEDVLQRQIMVAETVKYPVNFSPLIPFSASGVEGSPSVLSCSSMLHQPCSPSHIINQKPQQTQSHQVLPQDSSPVGLSSGDINIRNTLELASQLRKKDMFTQRKQREFIPDNKKDNTYWDRRRRNNEAAKKSREKRRLNDMYLEQCVMDLSTENNILKAKISAIEKKFAIDSESLIDPDEVISSMPSRDQLLGMNKRTKLPQILVRLNSTSSISPILQPTEMCADSYSPPLQHPPQEPSSPPPRQSPTHQMHQYPQPLSPGSPDHYGSQYATPVHNAIDTQETPYYGHTPHDMEVDTKLPPVAAHHYAVSSDHEDCYEQNVLNLSRTSSQSPPSPRTSSSSSSSMDCPSEYDFFRRSPHYSEVTSCLPHKLRHKTHLGEKDAAQSLLALQSIKTEPRDSHHHADDSSSVSVDDRDLGYQSSASVIHSASSSPASMHGNTSQNCGFESNDYERYLELKHMEMKVSKLRKKLGCPSRFEVDSDGSR